MILAYLQDGWLLDWLKQALTPGVALALVAIVIGTWWAAMIYVRFKSLETSVISIRIEMVTKHDLEGMGAKLQQWADGRFLTHSEFALNREEQDRIHGRQNDDIKFLLHREREANSTRAFRPNPGT